MSKFDKIVEKLLNLAGTFTFDELIYLLGKLGYTERRKGKTSGSRRTYVHGKTKHIIKIHKPHPSNELKRYVKEFIIEELKKENHI